MFYLIKYFQIGKYFQQESSKNNDKNQSMVTLLVNKDETTDKNLETKYKSALNTAKQYSKKLLLKFLII